MTTDRSGSESRDRVQIWAQGGYRVVIGSRDFTRGKLAAGEVSRLSSKDVQVSNSAASLERNQTTVRVGKSTVREDDQTKQPLGEFVPP